MTWHGPGRWLRRGSESEPLGKVLPERERARVVRDIHGQIQAAIRTHNAELQNTFDGTPQSLHNVIMSMGRFGLEALPKILGSQKIRIPEAPLTQDEANTMSDRGILDSPRAGQRRGKSRPEDIFEKLGKRR